MKKLADDRMLPLSFEQLLKTFLAEYRAKKTLAYVLFAANKKNVQLGVAAGPHTQMAQNIVACFAAGASVIELKTVQIIDGEDLKLEKPCIYSNFAVFNTEWSTELTVQQAADEYVKAFILIRLLGMEFSLQNAENVRFYPSIGYDLAGIKSQKIDSFINQMKDFSKSEEWKADFDFVKKNIDLFENITLADVQNLEKEGAACTCFTLSTMHGCPKEEIESIIKYLLSEKKVSTFVKMNPTLIGPQAVSQILNSKGYSLEIPDDVYEQNINLTQAVDIVKNCSLYAKKLGLKFGLKMTNTLPVFIKNEELKGERMYMSGPGLYTLSINSTKALLEKLMAAGLAIDEIEVSYSGGADKSNIAQLFECGIKTVTVCSILLKSGGYKNLSKLLDVLDERSDFNLQDSKINLKKLDELCRKSVETKDYDFVKKEAAKARENYSSLCAKCSNCVDVCPNRANVMYEIDDSDNKKIAVVNLHQLCNECGVCAKNCPMGHAPYLEKKRIEWRMI